jgi:hypothetical protein
MQYFLYLLATLLALVAGSLLNFNHLSIMTFLWSALLLHGFSLLRRRMVHVNLSIALVVVAWVTFVITQVIPPEVWRPVASYSQDAIRFMSKF